ncbi:hypothetical protein PQ472_11415 [Lacticaseibacillus pabuli]|uniref:Uncharacterized protein n=1 Tax=Lacticaseibacillus pabuli TaxID=3025672 RepID=A0ABY7WQU9_9LACO|nr:hypothetical protein [Lacticaseibacillus sp. KACC 23028]WDF82486.1 hypothetical protein PQ472_11415 [Lacticaseibacillus sp. KACC 23028]
MVQAGVTSANENGLRVRAATSPQVSSDRQAPVNVHWYRIYAPHFKALMVPYQSSARR